MGEDAATGVVDHKCRVLDPSGDTTQSIRGKADLYLAFTQAGKWVVTRWVDKRIDPFTSYGRWHGDQVGPE